MRSKVVAISISFFLASIAFADGPLKNSITLPAFKGKISAYLDLIELNSNALFSYSSNRIPADSIISKSVTESKISVVLNNVFGARYNFIESGNYIIIKPKNPKLKTGSVAPPSKEKKYVITGRVTNSITGEVISEAIVFDNDRLISTTTNKDGTYHLTVSSKTDFIPLSIKKDNYYDTLILVEPFEELSHKVDLKPFIKATAIDAPKVRKLPAGDSNRVQNMGLVSVIVPKTAFENTNSQEIEIERPAQISFLPMMGTNRRLSGMVENKISLNVLAGYSGAVNGVEIGGLVNVTRQNVSGFQVAGLGNVTGGVVSGFQVSGFFNNNRGNINGVQMAGFYNLVLDTVKGIQIAGFTNILHGKMDGLQVSGFTNITTKDVDGMQLTGFGNVALGNVDNLQIAGFSNYGNNVGGGQIAGFGNMALGSVGGGQIAGFINIAGANIGGWQVAGFMNVAGQQVKGGQIAGFINVAENVKGLQLAPFNFADSSSGLSIGIFSFIRKGYHSIGFNANETLPFGISFKSGTDGFYNIFSYSANPNNNLVGFGYGFGTLKRFKNKLYRSWEYEAYQLKSSLVSRFEFNMLSQLRLNIGYEITPWLNISAGPHYAMHIRDVLANNYPPIQNPFNSENFILGDTEWNHWLGGQVGLHFEF